MFHLRPGSSDLGLVASNAFHYMTFMSDTSDAGLWYALNRLETNYWPARPASISGTQAFQMAKSTILSS
jgi:hypothetical protein